jgi:hypothetical protein
MLRRLSRREVIIVSQCCGAAGEVSLKSLHLCVRC